MFYRIIILWVFIIFNSLKLGATVFKPTSLEGQLQTSDGWAYGKVHSLSYKKSTSGSVVTVIGLDIYSYSGIEKNEIVNPRSFKIMHPGGSWAGIKYHVFGAPNFIIGEEVIVLLNKLRDGFYVHNLSLGKYKVTKSGKSLFVRSAAFPDNHELGELSYDEFLGTANKFFGKSVVLSRDNSEVKVTNLKRKSRVPAQIIEGTLEKKVDENAKFSALIIVLFFSLFLFILFFLRGNKSL